MVSGVKDAFDGLASRTAQSMNALAMQCYGGEYRAVPDSTSSNDEEEKGLYPPVLFLEAVRLADDEDVQFLDSFTELALSHRVVVFIVTRTSNDAERIIEQVQGVSILPGAKKGRGPAQQWNRWSWTREDLSKYLMHKYGSFHDTLGRPHTCPQLFEEGSTNVLKFVVDGMTPVQAEQEASHEVKDLQLTLPSTESQSYV